jgi:hypothetical protein
MLTWACGIESKRHSLQDDIGYLLQKDIEYCLRQGVGYCLGERCLYGGRQISFTRERWAVLTENVGGVFARKH